VRFFLVRSHYRTDLNYSDVHLDDADNGLKRLYTALTVVPNVWIVPIDWSNPYAVRFKAAMDDDFGTPGAVAVLFDLAGEINKTKSAELAELLKALGGCLGILQNSNWLQESVESGATATMTLQNIEDHIANRAAAKSAKRFPQADAIRKLLLENGIVLKDSPAGTTWEAK
jgi:cysteinyl-tRNA synthetase